MRNEGGPYEYAVTVRDPEYNPSRRGWDYEVKEDATGLIYMKPEGDLKR